MDPLPFDYRHEFKFQSGTIHSTQLDLFLSHFLYQSFLELGVKLQAKEVSLCKEMLRAPAREVKDLINHLGSIQQLKLKRLQVSQSDACLSEYWEFETENI